MREKERERDVSQIERPYVGSPVANHNRLALVIQCLS
jgi:hypothetical protein